MMDVDAISRRLDEREHESWLDYITHCVEIAGFKPCQNALAFESPDGTRRISIYELDRALMHAPAQVVIQQIAQA